MDTTTTTSTTTDSAVTLPMPDAPAVLRDRLLIWYHERDQELAVALDPHIQLLIWRMRQRVRLHYYCYPTYEPDPKRTPEWATRKEAAAEVDTPEQRYTYAVQSFARAALFVPYLSPTFLLRFVRDDQRDARLHEALQQPDLMILPVPLAPYVGISSASLERPLVAYAPGYERQEAAARVVASIEAALRTQGLFEADGDPAEEVHPLFARLETPGPREAPRPRRFFLF